MDARPLVNSIVAIFMLRKYLLMFFLVVIYWLAAASAYNGFYTKWGLRDNISRFSVAAMMDGTAERPFVYRQLLPTVARAAEIIVPEKIKQIIIGYALQPKPAVVGMNIWGYRSGEADTAPYAVAYFVIYNLAFLSYFAALFLMRTFCLQSGMSRLSATAAPVLFSLLLPVLLSIGGFFYDFSEIFFMMAAVCVATRPRWRWLLIPITLLGTYNKESFLLFMLALSVLTVLSLKDRIGLLITGAALALGALVHLINRAFYQTDAGGDVHPHFSENILFYINPMSLLKATKTYGIPMLDGYNPITLLLIAGVIAMGLPALSRRLKLFSLACLVINLPMFILFAAPGETRNLSLLYPTFLLLIAATIERLDTRPAPPVVAG